jgi:hypothetical protein
MIITGFFKLEFYPWDTNLEDSRAENQQLN